MGGEARRGGEKGNRKSSVRQVETCEELW
jgi:hypothetical protein